MTDKDTGRREKFIQMGRTDVSLVFVVMFLMVFGIIMIYSSSYYHSLETFGSNTYFFIRQVVWVLVGTSTMFVVSRLNHKWLLKFSGYFYLIVVVLLILVLLQPEDINGSKRWLKVFGAFQFQPSELAKVGMILLYSAMLAGFEKYLKHFKVIIPILLIGAVPIALVGSENLSTAIVLIAILGGMLFAIYPYIIRLALMVGPILVGMGYFFFTNVGYRSSRVQIWLEGPFTDPLGKGYQTIQSLYAIGSGGFFGVGLGKSIQKIDFIPEAHNDIIFSIICEELGIFGAFSVLMLFGILLWRLFEILRQSADMESILIVVGVMVHIGIQVFINIGVVTNAIPATGIPLPFVSYGGSSLIFLLIEIGVVLSIARNNTIRLESRAQDE